MGGFSHIYGRTPFIWLFMDLFGPELSIVCGKSGDRRQGFNKRPLGVLSPELHQKVAHNRTRSTERPPKFLPRTEVLS